MKQILNNPFVVCVFFILIGLGITFYPTIHSCFELLPGGDNDARGNLYFLEHSWLWIIGDKFHSNYWDAPFFYPFKNMMAGSDILLGVAPFYWLYRLLGLSIAKAYLFWTWSLALLNFLSMFLFLCRICRFNNLTSATSAYLFAFCAPRIFFIFHIQLWTQFYSILSLYFLLLFVKSYTQYQVRKCRIALVCCAICVALQIYAGFYLGWFLIFGLSVYLFIALFFSSSRNLILTLFKNNWKWMGASLFLFLLIVSPMVWHYWLTGRITDTFGWDFTSKTIPTLSSFISTASFLYKPFADKLLFGHPAGWTQCIGLGLITPVLAIYGLIKYSQKNIWIKILTLCLFCFILLTIVNLSEYWFVLFPWKAIYKFYPGGSAIRVVSRIIFIIIICLSIGYAFFMRGRKILVQALLAFLPFAENASYGMMAHTENDYFNLSRKIAKYAQETNLPFAYVHNGRVRDPILTNLDAMWASNFSGRPTVNGYTSLIPNYDQFLFCEKPVNQLATHDFLKSFKFPYLLVLNINGLFTSRVIDNSHQLSEITNYIFNFKEKNLPINLTGFASPDTKNEARWSNESKLGFKFKHPLPKKFKLILFAEASSVNTGKEFLLTIGGNNYPFSLSNEPEQITLDINNPKSLSYFVIQKSSLTKSDKTENEKDELGIGIHAVAIKPDN